MTQERVVPRLPLALVLAAAAPTILVGCIEVADELDVADPGVSGRILGIFWLFTTVPLILVALGARRWLARLQTNAPDPAVAEALAAVARAEAAAERAAQALAKAETLLSHAGTGAPRSARSNRAARRAILIGVLVIGGGGLGVVLARAALEDKPIHVHAGFAVFANGSQITFDDAAFDLSERHYLRGHVHAGDPGIIHVEGKPGLTLGQFFQHALLTKLTDVALQLDTVVHDGARFETNTTHILRLFVAHGASDAWRPVADPAAYEPQSRDRILLTFGALAEDERERQQAAVPRNVPA